MSNFTQIFALGGDDDDDESGAGEEPERPPGSPRRRTSSERCFHKASWSLDPTERRSRSRTRSHTRPGLTFEFVAVARGLAQSEANRVFHEQHMFEEDELPDALLRIGFELADGRRVSNLGGWRAHRKRMSPDAEPEGPLLLPHAGGGGSSTRGRVTMKPGFWLWPLPRRGRFRSRASGRWSTSR